MNSSGINAGKNSNHDACNGRLLQTNWVGLHQQAQKQAVNHVAGKNVGEKTDRQGQQPRQRTDDFYGHNQPGDPPLGPGCEMLE